MLSGSLHRNRYKSVDSYYCLYNKHFNIKWYNISKRSNKTKQKKQTLHEHKNSKKGNYFINDKKNNKKSMKKLIHRYCEYDVDRYDNDECINIKSISYFKNYAPKSPAKPTPFYVDFNQQKKMNESQQYIGIGQFYENNSLLYKVLLSHHRDLWIETNCKAYFDELFKHYIHKMYYDNNINQTSWTLSLKAGDKLEIRKDNNWCIGTIQRYYIIMSDSKINIYIGYDYKMNVLQDATELITIDFQNNQQSKNNDDHKDGYKHCYDQYFDQYYKLIGNNQNELEGNKMKHEELNRLRPMFTFTKRCKECKIILDTKLLKECVGCNEYYCYACLVYYDNGNKFEGHVCKSCVHRQDCKDMANIIYDAVSDVIQMNIIDIMAQYAMGYIIHCECMNDDIGTICINDQFELVKYPYYYDIDDKYINPWNINQTVNMFGTYRRILCASCDFKKCKGIHCNNNYCLNHPRCLSCYCITYDICRSCGDYYCSKCALEAVCKECCIGKEMHGISDSLIEQTDFPMDIIDVITNYAIGIFVSCCNIECNRQIVINNSFEFGHSKIDYKGNKISYYTPQPRAFRYFEIVNVYGIDRRVFCSSCTDCREPCQVFRCGKTLDMVSICGNHPRCSICNDRNGWLRLNYNVDNYIVCRLCDKYFCKKAHCGYDNVCKWCINTRECISIKRCLYSSTDFQKSIDDNIALYSLGIAAKCSYKSCNKEIMTRNKFEYILYKKIISNGDNKFDLDIQSNYGEKAVMFCDQCQCKSVQHLIYQYLKTMNEAVNAKKLQTKSVYKYKYQGNGFEIWKQNGQQPILCKKLLFYNQLPHELENINKLKKMLTKKGGLRESCIEDIQITNHAGTGRKIGLIWVRDLAFNIYNAIQKIIGIEHSCIARSNNIIFIYEGGRFLEQKVLSKQASSTLIVKNFDILDKYCHKKMTKFFLRYGDLRKDIFINVDQKKEPFAIVEFKEKSDAKCCCDQMLFRYRKGRDVRLMIEGNVLQIEYGDENTKDLYHAKINDIGYVDVENDDYSERFNDYKISKYMKKKKRKKRYIDIQRKYRKRGDIVNSRKSMKKLIKRYCNIDVEKLDKL